MSITSIPLSRRAAIRTISAGVLPMILPGRLFGKEAPSRKINLLMLGCGRQGHHTNLPTLLGHPSVRVVAVCDVDLWRARVSKEKVDATYGTKDCRIFQDHREALELEGLNAVMVSSTDHWHVLHCLDAIRKGLHVSCEKPLTRYLAEGRLIADAAAKAGIVFRTDTECRSTAYMTKMADLVKNGYIGNVKRMLVAVPRESPKVPTRVDPATPPAELDYDRWLGPAPWKDYTEQRVHPVRGTLGRPGWMRIRDYSEGMISNWGTHMLDVAQLIHGSERSGPVSVEGKGRSLPENSELWNTLTEFEVRFKYQDGLVIDYRMDTPYLRVEGDEGWIQAPFGDAKGRFSVSDPKILRIKLKESDSRVPTRSDKADFVSAILDGTPVMCDAEVGHRTCSLGQISDIAVQRGKRLDWDPKTERFTNDDDANLLLKGTYREKYSLG
jgi:myo-inositol 2-dehydrogenase/D-chiro-inositol 1-dehydrogenase